MRDRATDIDAVISRILETGQRLPEKPGEGIRDLADAFLEVTKEKKLTFLITLEQAAREHHQMQRVEYVRRHQTYEKEIDSLSEDLELVREEATSLRQKLENQKAYYEGLLRDVQRLRRFEFKALLYATLGMAWVVTMIGVIAYFWK